MSVTKCLLTCFPHLDFQASCELGKCVACLTEPLTHLCRVTHGGCVTVPVRRGSCLHPLNHVCHFLALYHMPAVFNSNRCVCLHACFTFELPTPTCICVSPAFMVVHVVQQHQVARSLCHVQFWRAIWQRQRRLCELPPGMMFHARWWLARCGWCACSRLSLHFRGLFIYHTCAAENGQTRLEQFQCLCDIEKPRPYKQWHRYSTIHITSLIVFSCLKSQASRFSCLAPDHLQVCPPALAATPSNVKLSGCK